MICLFLYERVRSNFRRRKGGECAPVEEHDGAWVIQFIHLVGWQNLSTSLAWKHKTTIANLIEVRNLRDVAQVDHSKVLHFLRHTIEGLVHSHALGIPVVAEPNDDDPIFLGFDGFVNVPAGGEMREEVRHG